MSDNNPTDRSEYKYLLTALLIFSVFILQYSFRFADDNRLTSWQWTFANVDLVFFVPAFILGIALAYLLSMFPFYRSRPALFLFITSFILSSFFWSEPEVIVDASRYFTQAKNFELYGADFFLREWGKEIFAWTDTPLISFFYGLIFRSIGESRLYVQLFTTSLFALTSALTFFIGRMLWDEEVGFLAGAMILGIPFFYSQVPLMLVDIPTMFFLTLSVFTFCMAMDKGGMWILISSVAIFFAVLAKYSALMMLTVLPVIFLVYALKSFLITLPLIPSRQGRGELTRYTYRCLLVGAITGLLIAAVVWLKHDVLLEQLKLLREYQKPGLGRWGERFVSTFLFQVHPLITAAAIWSVYEAFRKRDARFIIISWLMFLIVVLQIRRSRYVMVAFPMLTLMAAYGLQRIRAAELKRFLVFGIISSAFVVALLAYLPFLKNMSESNIKKAGEFLDTVNTPDIEVFTIPSRYAAVNLAVSVPLLDLFTGKEVRYHHDSSVPRPFEEIKVSPLRFTWEFKNPRYYSTENSFNQFPTLEKGGKGGFSSNRNIVVVISNGRITLLPDSIAERIKGYRMTRAFDASAGIFEFDPVVTVYEKM